MNGDSQEALEKQLGIYERKERRDAEGRRLREGFDNMDARVLAELKDEQLSILLAKSNPGSPQFIRGEHERQSRLVKQIVRGHHRAAWIGVAGALLGAALGAVIASHFVH